MAGAASPPVVLVLVDGLGYDFVNESNTPNLCAYAAPYLKRSLKPALGYSDTQRAVLFTGLPPDKAGYWMLYRFARPGASPWRWLGALGLLDAAPGELPRKLLKYGLSAVPMKAAARIGGYDDLSIHNIPFRALPWFAPTLRRSMYAPGALGSAPTIFDLMRQARRPFGIIRSDTVSKLTLVASITRQVRRLPALIGSLDKATSFLYFYLHSSDMFAHRHGLRDPEFWGELKEVDRALVTIIEVLKEKLGADTQFILVSDHGMNHTERFASFQRLVTHPRYGKDYVAALDSTMVTLSYLNAAGPKAARPLVEDSGLGCFLTRDERRELGVDFPGEQYGDDLYLLRPGVSIYPNFHSLLKPLAMHAYHPDEPDQQAVAIFIGGGVAEQGARPQNLGMKDILPMVSSTLGLGRHPVHNRSR